MPDDAAESSNTVGQPTNKVEHVESNDISQDDDTNSKIDSSHTKQLQDTSKYSMEDGGDGVVVGDEDIVEY